MTFVKKLIDEYKEGKQRYARFGLLVLSSRIILRLFKPVVSFYSERIYEKDLTGDEDISALPPPGITMTLLPPDRHDELRALSEYPDKDYIPKRLADGHTCFLAIGDDKIVFYAWGVMGERFFFDGTTTWPLRVKSNEAYIYNCFTAPEFRGRGIFPYILKEAARFYRDRSASVLKAIVYGRNYASWRSFEKAGYTLSTKVRYMKFFFLKKPLYFKMGSKK